MRQPCDKGGKILHHIIEDERRTVPSNGKKPLGSGERITLEAGCGLSRR